MFSTSSLPGPITLDATGLVALADLSAVALRTALMGTASYLDILVLAPAMHTQQSADDINRGEFPMTGSMTTGNIFRVENPATVRYLQDISRTGCLVTAKVSLKPRSCNTFMIPLSGVNLSPIFAAGARAALLYLLWIGRVRKRRDILTSSSSSVRIAGSICRGSINDLKTATAGQWLRDKTAEESFGIGVATLLVYASAALASNASTAGSLLAAVLRHSIGTQQLLDTVLADV